jgi:hypothetical protein
MTSIKNAAEILLLLEDKNLLYPIRIALPKGGQLFAKLIE